MKSYNLPHIYIIAKPIAMTELPSNLGRNVVDAIIALIRDRRLRSGDSLPSEADIAASVGVSRTVVREAFGAMAALRLIDVGSGRRPRVGAIDDQVIGLPLRHAVDTAQATVAQLWDARRALERRTAELAAIRRTDAEARAILDHAAALRGAGYALAEQTEHDIAFHLAIAAATGNPIFPLMVGAFSDVMRHTCPIGWRSRRTEAERLAVFDQHDRIAQAIEARDPDGAEQAMMAHFDLSLRALTNSGFN